MKTSSKIATACAALGLLAVVACQASGSAHGSGKAGPVSWHGGASYNGPGSDGCTIFNDSDKCFDMKFYDAAGNETGSATITPGANHGGVPAGTTSWSAVEKDCPEGEGEGASGLVSGQRQNAAGGLQLMGTYSVIGMPMFFADNSVNDNAIYEFNVRASSAAEALVIAHSALESPVGSPVDSRISIVTWLRAQQGNGVGKIIGLARTPFTQFDVELNRVWPYADLATNQNAIQSQLPYGLSMVEVNVSMTDLNGYGVQNSVVVHLNHAGTPAGQTQETALSLTHNL